MTAGDDAYIILRVAGFGSALEAKYEESETEHRKLFSSGAKKMLSGYNDSFFFIYRKNFFLDLFFFLKNFFLAVWK